MLTERDFLTRVTRKLAPLAGSLGMAAMLLDSRDVNAQATTDTIRAASSIKPAVDFVIPEGAVEIARISLRDPSKLNLKGTYADIAAAPDRQHDFSDELGAAPGIADIIEPTIPPTEVIEEKPLTDPNLSASILSAPRPELSKTAPSEVNTVHQGIDKIKIYELSNGRRLESQPADSFRMRDHLKRVSDSIYFLNDPHLIATINFIIDNNNRALNKTGVFVTEMESKNPSQPSSGRPLASHIGTSDNFPKVVYALNGIGALLEDSSSGRTIEDVFNLYLHTELLRAFSKKGDQLILNEGKNPKYVQGYFSIDNPLGEIPFSHLVLGDMMRIYSSVKLRLGVGEVGESGRIAAIYQDWINAAVLKDPKEKRRRELEIVNDFVHRGRISAEQISSIL